MYRSYLTSRNWRTLPNGHHKIEGEAHGFPVVGGCTGLTSPAGIGGLYLWSDGPFRKSRGERSGLERLRGSYSLVVLEDVPLVASHCEGFVWFESDELKEFPAPRMFSPAQNDTDELTGVSCSSGIGNPGQNIA